MNFSFKPEQVAYKNGLKYSVSPRTPIHNFLIIQSRIVAKKMDKLIVNASTEASDYEDEFATESTTESIILRTEESDYEDEFTTESATETCQKVQQKIQNLDQEKQAYRKGTG
eukprot:Pgem_evm2s16052